MTKQARTIWVDADACPKAIKEILFRVAERTETPVILVANRWIHTPSSPHISLVQVDMGPDIADDEIANRCQSGDIVVTADIPLAARAVDKGAHVLDPRGKLYTPDNIKQILSMRDFMDSLRGSGIETGGPAALDPQSRNAFANHLDRILAAP